MAAAESVITFLNSPMGWVTIAGVGGIVGMILYQTIVQRDNRGFKPTDIRDIVSKDLHATLESTGDYSSVPVRRGLTVLGSLKLYKRINVSKRDAKGNLVKDEDGKKETEAQYLLVIRPTGFPQGYAWKALNTLGWGHSRFEAVIILPRDNVKFTDAVEIDEDIHLTKFADVWMARDRESYDVIEEVVVKEIMEDNLERDANWIKSMNWKDREMSKRLQEMEKESGLRQQYFKSRSEHAMRPDE